MNKKKITMLAPVAVAVLFFSVLAAIPLTSQVFAQIKRTQLTLNVSAGTKGASSYLLTGKLSSEGKGISGKSIILKLLPLSAVPISVSIILKFLAGKIGNVMTGPDGTYSFNMTKPVGFKTLSTSYIIEADYAGDSDHLSTLAKRVITVTS
jgi:hypothetical protein